MKASRSASATFAQPSRASFSAVGNAEIGVNVVVPAGAAPESAGFAPGVVDVGVAEDESWEANLPEAEVVKSGEVYAVEMESRPEEVDPVRVRMIRLALLRLPLLELPPSVLPPKEP
jgi:hypothetical protein